MLHSCIDASIHSFILYCSSILHLSMYPFFDSSSHSSFIHEGIMKPSVDSSSIHFSFIFQPFSYSLIQIHSFFIHPASHSGVPLTADISVSSTACGHEQQVNTSGHRCPQYEMITSSAETCHKYHEMNRCTVPSHELGTDLLYKCLS